MKPLSLLSLLLCTFLAYGSHLGYMEIPIGVNSIDFVANLARNGVDVRGDRADYVLVVDANCTAGFESWNIFDDYDTVMTSYFVIERAGPEVPLETSGAIFSIYRWVAVKNTFVFAIPKDEEDTFVTQIPLLYKAVFIPIKPLPVPATNSHEFELPGAPDPDIAQLVAQVSSTDIYDFVTYLTGEASSIWTRQSQSTGAVQAQNYLELTFASFGFSVATQPFRTGYSYNVIATLTGTLYPTQIVLVCAHYDDRGPTLSSTTNRAPGANDNGSGTGALLQIAKIIGVNKLSFAYTVVIIAFSGEEQGLYGSAYSAQQYYNQKANIIAVLNADMIAYRATNAPSQLDFVSRSTTLALTRTLTNITRTYVPQLTIGSTTACCTDAASFYDYGFPSASFCERNGYTVDPQYHQVGDLVNRAGYDVKEQYPQIVQAMLAGLLTIAELQ